MVISFNWDLVTKAFLIWLTLSLIVVGIQGVLGMKRPERYTLWETLSAILWLVVIAAGVFC